MNGKGFKGCVHACDRLGWPLLTNGPSSSTSIGPHAFGIEINPHDPYTTYLSHLAEMPPAQMANGVRPHGNLESHQRERSKQRCNLRGSVQSGDTKGEEAFIRATFQEYVDKDMMVGHTDCSPRSLIEYQPLYHCPFISLSLYHCPSITAITAPLCHCPSMSLSLYHCPSISLSLYHCPSITLPLYITAALCHCPSITVAL